MFAPIVVTKPIDAASPILAVDVANGRHIPQVVIDLCTDADCSDGAYFTQVLRDVVLVGATNATPGAGRVLQEQITFDYRQIEWRYHRADGAGDVVGTWDRAAGSA